MVATRVIFLGSGTSEGVPRVTCLTDPDKSCVVCTDAMRPGSKNRRRNTSLLIQRPAEEGNIRNIVIDVGKFFYESAIQWFPEYEARDLDAVVLTHAHADAAGGLDDLRDWTNYRRHPVQVFAREIDMRVLSKTHYYLVPGQGTDSAGSVARLEFELFDESPFEVQGLMLTPLTVEHGKGFTTSGFRFGDVCYVPDTSGIPDATAKLMVGCDLLIIDALRPESTHGSHLTIEQAIEEVRRLKPRRAMFTDMAHDVDHEPVNRQLRSLLESDGLDIRLAYDGMSFETET